MGDAQIRTLIMKGITSNTLTENSIYLAFSGNGIGTVGGTLANNCIISHHRYDPNVTSKQYTWYYTIKVVGRSLSSAAPESAAYKFEGILESSFTNGILLIGNTKTIIYEDNADWDCNIYAYNTDSPTRNDGMYIQCSNTLSLDEPIYWLAHIEILEIGITEMENPIYY